MLTIADHARSLAATAPVDRAVLARDAGALARVFEDVGDDFVSALMDGFEPQEGIGGTCSSISLAELCLRRDAAAQFVTAPEVGACGLRDDASRDWWLDILCTSRLHGDLQGGSLADGIDGDAHRRGFAQAVLDASATDAARASWAQGHALEMLADLRRALADCTDA